MLVDRRFNCTKEEIAAVPLPVQTRSYMPVGHRELRDELVSRFKAVGRDVMDEGYHMRKDGNILLGMVLLKPKNEKEEKMPLTALLRNSYDKSWSAGVALGPSVTYCLNMCISGSDVTYLRKHTKNVWRDLGGILDQAIGSSEDRYLERMEEVERLEQLPVSEESGYEVLGRLAGMEILKPRMFSSAMREWKKPRFPVFEERNAWSLYNAVTWGIKAGSPVHVTSANPKAHKFFAALVQD